MPELTISPEKVAFLIEKAREFDVKEQATDEDSGSNAADELRREAAGQRDRHTARYLLGEPMLGDLLAEGLDAFGIDWTEGRTTADSSSPSQRDEDEITKR
ncbi:DUF3775 domain-containing protein [Bradyrhizobium oligotrophicum]|uniref:DUF3775 domain-containing protein n=1 Tax=Bradyrhizobium oligotrophicum TaxID=44255 RepID=UPI003EB7ED4D